MRERFIRDDHTVPDWLEATEDGHPLIQPDRVGAMQLLVAATGADPNRMAVDLDRILRERDAVPLVSGLVTVGLTLGLALFGKRRDQMFTQMLASYEVDDCLSSVVSEEEK